jgi:hypothetical protein
MPISGGPFSGYVTDVSFSPVVGTNKLDVSCQDGVGDEKTDSVSFTVCDKGYYWDNGDKACYLSHSGCDYPAELQHAIIPFANFYCWFKAGLNNWGYNKREIVTPIDPNNNPNFP